MDLQLSRDAQRWVGRLPEIANLFLIVLIGLAIARLFWLAWPAPDMEVVPRDTSPKTSQSAGPVDIDTIAAAHMFGHQDKNTGKAQPQKIVNAPETNLNLVLTGIVSEKSGRRSRALIEKPKGKQDSYAKGDQITDHVKLHAIYTNRVILDRGGHYETLTLESVKKARSMADKSRQRAAGNAVSEQVAQSLNEARKKILADPSNASRYIRLRPARRSGKLVGYRIFPGSNGGLFKQAGLKSGELVTAINGKPLNKPAKALQQLSKLSDASSARITLERNGRKHTIVVNFK